MMATAILIGASCIGAYCLFKICRSGLPWWRFVRAVDQTSGGIVSVGDKIIAHGKITTQSNPQDEMTPVVSSKTIYERTYSDHTFSIPQYRKESRLVGRYKYGGDGRTRYVMERETYDVHTGTKTETISWPSTIRCGPWFTNRGRVYLGDDQSKWSLDFSEIKSICVSHRSETGKNRWKVFKEIFPGEDVWIFGEKIGDVIRVYYIGTREKVLRTVARKYFNWITTGDILMITTIVAATIGWLLEPWLIFPVCLIAPVCTYFSWRSATFGVWRTHWPAQA